jgi:UDP-GlcNAc:undecaprenyl-phosphate GlcNAc-1-phosphate transferase
MTDWEQVAAVGALALCLSLLFVPVARRSALRLGVTDRPGAGKVHTSPTPYLGGVAVAAAVVCGAAAGGWQREFAAILAAAAVVSCIGLVDDIRTASPRIRLLVEAVAACVAYLAGARFELLGGGADLALTVVWLVVLTNAYNLLDNMDACASLVVGTTAAAVLGAAVLQDQPAVGTVAIAIVGAVAGFLVFNWHPARIFLGDAGALFLGFLVSAMALKLRFPGGDGTDVLAVGLVAAPALFDTTLVVISRVRSGRPIYVGGTDHTSHRLAHLGMSTRPIGVVLAVASAGCGAMGVAVGREALDPRFAIAPLVVLGLVFLAILLRLPVYAAADQHRLVPAPAAQPVRRRPTRA